MRKVQGSTRVGTGAIDGDIEYDGGGGAAAMGIGTTISISSCDFIISEFVVGFPRLHGLEGARRLGS